MKIKFQKNDSIYKIFKTIEKIPNNKHIQIYIDPHNPFFENIWWGKQFLDLLQSKKLNFTVISEDNNSNKYYEKLGIQVHKPKKYLLFQIGNYIYNYFFKVKTLQINLFYQKNYFAYIIIGAEIALVCYIFYFFYNIITPQSQIFIKPRFTQEEVVYNFRFYPINKIKIDNTEQNIYIPYYSGNFNLNHTLNYTVKNIKYFQKPSKGKITLINELDKTYSLLANTKFITEEGLIFKTTNWLHIPGKATGTGKNQTIIELEAMDTDIYGKTIGERGNIPINSKLYIKNLNESHYLKKVYALSIENFKGGQTISDGIVKKEDIDLLKTNLQKYLDTNKQNLIKELFKKNNNNNDKILINFVELMNISSIKIDIPAQENQKIANITGNIQGIGNYKYILNEDFKKAIMQYIDQRKANNINLVDIETERMLMYELYKSNNNIYTIPTKVEITFGYDLKKDVNNIKEEIKSKIIGKELSQAQEIILAYPEIDVAIIQISPPWYKTIPTLKSRINIIGN